MNEKRQRGKVYKWKKFPIRDGIGYRIEGANGLRLDNISYHNQKTGEVETPNGIYFLVGLEDLDIPIVK